MPLIIAIDGYSSCGKSTFARMIAREINFVYIDSGAMYRAVALYALRHKLIGDKKTDQQGIIKSLSVINISFTINNATGIQETCLNGENIEKEIRGIEVSKVVSKISQIREVRQKMVALQREIGKQGNVVMDGRDIGSTVFPEATFKIFMVADTEIRAKRRYQELIEKGISTTMAEVIENIRMRDTEDENRVESPLRKANDAVILDNSHMTLNQQMNWFTGNWKSILKLHEH